MPHGLTIPKWYVVTVSVGNPFEYVRPLPPATVRGRDGLSDQLLRAVRDRRLVALGGPRRFGKTTVLGQVVDRAAEVDHTDAVTVDCFGVASIGEFAVRLERAMADLTGPARRLVRRLFDVSELGLSVAPGVGFKAAFGRKDAPDPTAALHGLLTALVSVADRRHGLLLVLDEFQDVTDVAGLDAVLRTYLQRAPNIAVLFAGSRPSLLRALFDDRTRPFYGQAEIVEVGPLDEATAATIIDDGFATTDRDAGDAGEIIATLVEGHPQRLMLVANLLWEQVAPRHRARTDDVAAALEATRIRTAPEHQAVIGSLSRTHRDTIRAVASFGSPYARIAERTLSLGRGSAQSAARALEAEALIARGDGGWTVVDPLLADWLRHHLPAPGS
jgi:hypothetical protein